MSDNFWRSKLAPQPTTAEQPKLLWQDCYRAVLLHGRPMGMLSNGARWNTLNLRTKQTVRATSADGAVSKRPKIDPEHAVAVTKALYDQWTAKRATDLKVTCGVKTFELHSSVVGCGSGYFRVLIDGGAWAKSTPIVVEDIEPCIFEQIAESLYAKP